MAESKPTKDTENFKGNSSGKHGNIKHGQSHTLVYRAFLQMLNRCFKPNVKEFKHYGARGITVCERWRTSFQAFIDDMGPRPDGYSIERIDNNGNYEPNNCKWASKTDQARNTREGIYITHEGETLHLKEWAERTGIKYGTLWMRRSLGQELFVPLKKKRRITSASRP